MITAIGSVLRISAVVALLAGVATGMILDGQALDHAIIGAVCGCLTFSCAWLSQRGQRRKGRIMIVAWLGLLMTALSLWVMPSAYRSQRRFNQKIEEFRILREQSDL